MTRNEVLHYVKERYGTEPEYPWQKTPTNAILRHDGNKKWYGAILTVAYARLGLAGEGNTDVLNVKCGPDWSYLYTREPGIVPGYHMNKQHWISILLDGTVSASRICALIELSYTLTKGK